MQGPGTEQRTAFDPSTFTVYRLPSTVYRLPPTFNRLPFT